MEDNGIYILINYGVTRIKLKEILLEKGISRNKVSFYFGFSAFFIIKLYSFIALKCR